MAYSASTLTQRCRRFMGDWPDLNTLAISLSTNATSLTFSDSTNGLSPNWLVQVDQEAIVVGASVSATSSNVRRGYWGTTAVSHANSSSVLIRPAFIDQDYLDALNAAILATYPLLYRPVIDESLTAAAGTYEYTVPNMPSTYDGANIVIPNVYGVQVKDTGDTVWRDKQDWSILRGATPKLKFKHDEAGTIRLLGFGPIAPLASFTDSLDTLYPVQAVDALIEYACGRLLASGESRRVRVDVGTIDQREQANKVGSSSAAGRDLYQRFSLRLRDAAMPPLPRHIRTGV